MENKENSDWISNIYKFENIIKGIAKSPIISKVLQEIWVYKFDIDKENAEKLLKDLELTHISLKI